MYISWQVLNAFFKGKATPTTDKGWMYTAAGPSGGFHVKWHKISEDKPVVDRFHVTFEATSKKAYYGITTNGYVYLGNRPNSGPITKETAAQLVGTTPLAEFDTVAAGFLRSVNQNLKASLRLEQSEAIADDKALDKAAAAQKDRSKIIGELRTKYSSFTDQQFTKAGLTKLGVTQRFGPEWTPKYYEEIIAKLEVANATMPTATETPTTASSAVFAGTKVPLPMPKGLTVEPGAVTTLKPIDPSGGSTPAPSKFGASRPWHK